MGGGGFLSSIAGGFVMFWLHCHVIHLYLMRSEHAYPEQSIQLQNLVWDVVGEQILSLE